MKIVSHYGRPPFKNPTLQQPPLLIEYTAEGHHRCPPYRYHASGLTNEPKRTPVCFYRIPSTQQSTALYRTRRIHQEGVAGGVEDGVQVDVEGTAISVATARYRDVLFNGERHADITKRARETATFVIYFECLSRTRISSHP